MSSCLVVVATVAVAAVVVGAAKGFGMDIVGNSREGSENGGKLIADSRSSRTAGCPAAVTVAMSENKMTKGKSMLLGLRGAENRKTDRMSSH